MDLRQYLAVLRRRWPLLAAIVLLTAILSGGLLLTQRPTYTAVAVLAMRQIAQPPPTAPPGVYAYTYDNYYNWYSSDFLADDYTLIVPSQAFAAQVNAKLQQQSAPVGAGWVLSASRQNRELTVAASAPSAAAAAAVVRAAADVLTDLSSSTATTPSLNKVVIHDNALFALIDEAPANGAGAVSNRARQITNAVIALGVGLALALALAFLAEYLDNRLRDSADAEQVIGLPIIGAIPVHR